LDSFHPILPLLGAGYLPGKLLFKAFKGTNVRNSSKEQDITIETNLTQTEKHEK
jgi:hypothetical protein